MPFKKSIKNNQKFTNKQTANTQKTGVVNNK